MVADFSLRELAPRAEKIDADAVFPQDALAMLAFYYQDMKMADKEAEVEKRVLAINPKHADYYCSIEIMRRLARPRPM